MTKNWNYNKKIGLEKDNSLGNTNTPPEVAKQVVEKLVDLSLVNEDSTFLEPCVGSGSFYFAIVDHLSKKFKVKHILSKMIYAYEVDSVALDMLKKEAEKKYGIEPKNLILGNFLLERVPILFDWVITNPPYIASSKMTFKGFKSREEMISSYRKIDDKISKKSDIYIYFFIKTLKLLKDGGKQVFLCSDSWIDSNFGDILKNYLSNDYNLDMIVSNRLYSLFRDDTSPVLTLISKSKNDTIKIYQSDEKEFGYSESNPSLSLSKKDFLKFINNEKLNKRNLFVLFGKEFLEGLKFVKTNKEKLNLFKNLINLESSSITFNDLKKEGSLIEGSSENKIFFQIQARVNKPPNYKNLIRTDELLYSVDLEKNKELKLKEKNAYISTIIDRYPLVFYVKDQSTFHVSKYLSLSFKKDHPIELIPVIMSNLVTLYLIEIFVKEGTRKTLRVGEMGFGKELRKSELEDLYILDIDKLSKSALGKILENQLKLENVILYNIEEALKNEYYIDIQKTIIKDLDISLTFEELKEKVLSLYYRRMRNISKIEEKLSSNKK